MHSTVAPRTMGRAASMSEYPRLSPVQVVRQVLGCEESTARQVLNLADDRNPWRKAARLTERLVAAGHVLASESRCKVIDLARQPRPLFVSQEAFRAALEVEQRTDGEEDVAELFVSDAASFRTWERRALRHIDHLFTAIRIGRALYGVEPC